MTVFGRAGTLDVGVGECGSHDGCVVVEGGGTRL